MAPEIQILLNYLGSSHRYFSRAITGRTLQRDPTGRLIISTYCTNNVFPAFASWAFNPHKESSCLLHLRKPILPTDPDADHNPENYQPTR